MGLNGTLQTSRIITQFRLAVLCVCQFIMAQVQLEREYQEARRQEVDFFLNLPQTRSILRLYLEFSLDLLKGAIK